jgi:endonuclease/exonuclease/phosphatase family metal-dependent hydrolase
MTIISLNIWGGRAGRDKLLPFFEKYRDIADIFCLQEVWSGRYEDYEGTPAGGRPIDHTMVMTQALQEISALLPDHAQFFHPSLLSDYGQAMFVRSSLPVSESGDVFVHHERGFVPTDDLGNHARNMQYVNTEHAGNELTVMNIHGLWNGKGKTDCPERLAQSDRMLEFIGTLSHPYVLVGDFNLLPDTESLRKFEQAGMRNLISEYGITSTRTSLYDRYETGTKYADYAFVSEDMKVVGFEVLPDIVSDHAALRLDIA